MAALRAFYTVVVSVEYSVASKVGWLVSVMDGMLVAVWVVEKDGQMGHDKVVMKVVMMAEYLAYR